MRSMGTLGITITAGWLSLAGCSAVGTTDAQVGPMGIVGPAGPVGPMGSPGSGGTASYDELDLPGTSFYPESLTSAADGTIFVGSFGGPRIAKFAPGSNTAVPFVTQLSAGGNINGVLVDEMDQSLLACVNDVTAFGVFKPLVKRFALADGSEKASYAFLAPGACNDMAFDGAHNLFVTDSFGQIYKLASGGQTLTAWSADTALRSTVAGGFGADGIVWDGGSNLYVNTFSDSRLLRIPIDGAGAAGTPVPIVVTPALSNPDGMRSINANTLLIVEGAGRLTRVTVSGTTATGIYLSNRLSAPTAVTKIGNNYFVSEGQLSHFLAMPMTTPDIPFLVRRVPNF